MRRTPIRKKGKQKISVIQRKIWEHCKRITRERYGNTCYTCPAINLIGFNWQTGHMWAKASVGAYLKYDLRILRPQCNTCNQFRGGMGADFYKRMLAEIGPEAMEKLEKDRQIIVNAISYYQKILEEYSKL